MITEEQIIKYLEHCSTTESCHKDKCPCLKDGHTCIAFESKPVLELVKSQKAEIELWKEEDSSVGCANEWLKAYLKNAEAEAIKEFAEKVDKLTVHTIDDDYMVWKSKFDNLILDFTKMVGGD